MGLFDDLAKATRGLAQFYLIAGLYREGVSLFGQALQRLTRLPSGNRSPSARPLRLEFLLAESKMRLRLGDLNRAERSAQVALRLAQSLRNSDSEIDALISLSYAHGQRGDREQAHSVWERALALAQESDNTAQEGHALRYLGTSLMDFGEYAQAKAVLERSLAIQQMQQNLNEEQAAALYLGVTASETYDYQEALHYFKLALNLIQRIGNRSLEARIQNATGFTTAALGDLDGALPFHQRSRHIARDLGERVQESHALHNLCTVERKRGNLDAAEVYGRKALDLVRSTDLLDPIACALLHLGYVWMEQEKIQEALSAFEQSHALWLQQDKQSLAIETLAGMAAASFKLGDHPGAHNHLESVLASLATFSVNGCDEPSQLYLTCYQLLVKMGDERAGALLASARSFLLQIADTIDEPSARDLFWQRVPTHRALMDPERVERVFLMSEPPQTRNAP